MGVCGFIFASYKIKIMIKVYPVTGLHCANCAINVEKTLKKQPGISSASVNFADSTARIEYDTKEASDALTLQSAVRSIGYDMIIDEEPSAKVAEDEQARYKKLRARTIFSIILAVPVIVISMIFMKMPYANFIMLALTLPVLVWSGSGFFINAFKQARHGKANMDTLVAMSTGIAFLFSVFNTFFPHFWHARGLHPHVYYEAASAVIAFILVGKLLEERAKAGTSSAIKKLMGMQASTVIRLDDKGKETEVSISMVKHGEMIRVRPGDRIPVDGEILSGSSTVDESSMTGESIPAERGTGDKVYAGTINLNGSFVLTALQVGSETMLSRIIDTVRQAQGSKAPVQKTVDRIAGIFVPVVIGISILSFAVWMIFGGENPLSHALLAMVTVLVIACPCALGLATPTAIMVGMGKGAQNGILIRDAESLETIHRINALVLDKTGTITEGRPVVKDIQWFIPAVEQQEALKILKGLEKHSSHPLAEAVIRHLDSVSPVSDTGSSFENLPGLGVRGIFSNKTYLAGNLKLMEEQGVTLPMADSKENNKESRTAQSRIYFAAGSVLLAVIDLTDQIKETAVEAIMDIQKMGIEVHMLTGDNLQTAQDVAESTGIVSFRANLLPDGKSEYIQKLQKDKKIVAMVGDGINDSQALVQADVSIAMGRGSDIAMDVAGMTLVSSDLRQIARAIRLSKLTVKTINQNLFWAFIYNLIGIPIAAGILYPIWGFMLNPMIAAAAMAMSSVSVVSNSLRLRSSKIGTRDE
jgi:P-type Cu2+ transporter